MIGDTRLLAIIPARGGSKRLPGKNILDLAGKPLIAWTIEAAKKSKYIDRVVVSTDDDQISEISKKYGADIPFLRPVELSTDKASSIDVVTHTVIFLEDKNDVYDFVVLLQPTSPMRDSQHIDEAISFMNSQHADSIVSVCEVDHSPLWCSTLPEDMSMCHFLSDSIKNSRSQDLPMYYRVNGAIYICKKSRLMDENTLFFKNNVFAYLMDKESSVDIDDKMNFDFASFLVESKNV